MVNEDFYMIAEKLYKSMGFAELPESFYSNSVFNKSSNEIYNVAKNDILLVLRISSNRQKQKRIK